MELAVFAIGEAEESSLRDLKSPNAIAISTNEIGNAAAIEAVCKAFNPPASSKTPATKPSPIPQMIRKILGGSSSPMDSIVVMTSVPESEDVMNQDARSRVASADRGHCSQLTSPIQDVFPRFAMVP